MCIRDSCKIYQKRPIYWLFDSGKKNGFKCLIYMHRYQPDTIARIRTDYVHEQQARYRTAIEGLEKQVAAATSTSERVKLTKQLNKVQAQDAELHQYEEKVHALADQMIKIDLDDGEMCIRDRAKIDQTMEYLVSHVYSKLDLIGKNADTDADILAVLSGADYILPEADPNRDAEAAVEEYLEMQVMHHLPTSMADVPVSYTHLDVSKRQHPAGHR